jgi:DNA recombination protein RmuC
MTSTTAELVVAVALLLGFALGWSCAARRTESRTSDTVRQALADAAALRAQLEAEQQAAERRESLLVRADAAARDVLGEQAGELLERVQRQLEELQRARAGSDSVLREQARAITESSQRLEAETAALVSALRAPQTRGRWGEMQLERVVEAAGMTEHVDYTTQVTTSVDGLTQRPDLVVHLSTGRQVVVDAKAPLAGYLAALEARDEASRAAAFKAHARHLRAHIESLSAKQYWQQFSPTPEFVVCFLPADPFLDAALREEPTLLEHAFVRDVVLATPSTLVALLRTIAYSWRQEKLAADVAAVHQCGRELYARLVTTSGHLERLGRTLGGAVAAYNETVGSLERRVLPSARRMAELGVAGPASGTLLGPETVLEAVPRPLSSPEWDVGETVA